MGDEFHVVLNDVWKVYRTGKVEWRFPANGVQVPLEGLGLGAGSSASPTPHGPQSSLTP